MVLSRIKVLFLKEVEKESRQTLVGKALFGIPSTEALDDGFLNYEDSPQLPTPNLDFDPSVGGLDPTCLVGIFGSGKIYKSPKEYGKLESFK